MKFVIAGAIAVGIVFAAIFAIGLIAEELEHK